MKDDKKTSNFYKDLSDKESSGKMEEINRFGYVGLFQMGENALIDTGYYIRGKIDITNKNDWTGSWTGKDGIKNLDDFLNNPQVQLNAATEYHQRIWNSYLKDYHIHEGKTINGITLTKSGMIAASHLVGAGGLKEFINSNGKIVPGDGNKVKCTEYLSKFSNYDLDYTQQISAKLISAGKSTRIEFLIKDDKGNDFSSESRSPSKSPTSSGGSSKKEKSSGYGSSSREMTDSADSFTDPLNIGRSSNNHYPDLFEILDMFSDPEVRDSTLTNSERFRLLAKKQDGGKYSELSGIFENLAAQTDLVLSFLGNSEPIDKNEKES